MDRAGLLRRPRRGFESLHAIVENPDRHLPVLLLGAKIPTGGPPKNSGYGFSSAAESLRVIRQSRADVLADTNNGLSGTEIVRELGAYAIEFNVNIPRPQYPFDAPNKRTALAQNLLAFSEQQRYRIILDLCDHPSIQVRNRDAARKIKLQLMAR